MPVCCVPNCKNRYVEKERQNFSFHRFPACKAKRREWLKMIGLEHFTPTPSSRVCSWHFADGIEAGPIRFHPKVKDTSMPSKLQEELQLLAEAASLQKTPKVVKKSRRKVVTVERELIALKAEHMRLRSELESLKWCFSFAHIEADNDRIRYYTGLPNRNTFLAVLNNLHHQQFETSNVFPPTDQLLLSLMKLRLNLDSSDLSVRFNCSREATSDIFAKVVSALYDILYEEILSKKLAPRVEDEDPMPTRASTETEIVLDCAEILVANSEKLRCSSCSNYKGNTVMKVLLGTSPGGEVQFVSRLYGGNTSHADIVTNSGILKMLSSGDVVLANEEFDLKDRLPPDIIVRRPDPLTLLPHSHCPQSVCAHKRVCEMEAHELSPVHRFKSYQILCRIPHDLQMLSNKIVRVCACLVNMHSVL